MTFLSPRSLANYTNDEELIIGQHIAVVTNIAQGSGQGVGARCLGTHTHHPVSLHAKCNEMQSSVECEYCTVFYLH